MTKLAASDGDIDTSDQLSMASAYGKVFIANGTNLKVADFQNSKIATANLGANPPDRGNILTGGTSGGKMIVDYITALSSACVLYGYRTTTATFSTGETVTGTDDDGNAISFAMTAVNEVAAPHWYDWTVYGNDTTLFGTMPDQAYLVGVSGGRLILSGDRNYPHQAPTSASGNPWDWNIYRTTADRATAIGTGPAGAIGDVVRAIIPVRDGQCVFGCAGSMHVMIDNPAFGGRLVAVDKTIGIFDGTSWCFDGDGDLWFWGTGGLHKMGRGAMAVETITKEALPDIVSTVAADPSTHRVTMGYDPLRIGIKICITLLADGSSQVYWYDLRTQGFFYDTDASDDHGAYSQYNYNANDPDLSGLIMGCTDGYMRVEDDTAANDDGSAIDSYVDYGPVPLAPDGRDGSLAAFDVVLSGGGASGSESDSDDVYMYVWAEEVAGELYEKLIAGTSYKLSLTFKGPGRRRGGKRRRGVRGAYAGIRIGNNTAGETWGFEKLLLEPGAPGRRLR
ncbi:MAG: hypothetical protein GY832_31575 [Chloroflexi bacterium]|nr:hypothetical protein [Chloroflexota bacterium]